MKVNIVFSMKAKPHNLIVFAKRKLFKTYDSYSYKVYFVCNYELGIP